MRGKHDPQAILFTAAIDLEQRIRSGHPLRAIKRMVDEDLGTMSRHFDAAYADQGRPSVPPERLIKALLLQSIYSVRSEAQQVERIDHDLLFRWFLDLRIDEPVFDATVFSHNRKRLEEHGLNRHGLVLGVEVNSPLDNSEPNTALSLIDRVKKRFRLKPRTVGADKGYDQGPLLRGLERRKIHPHVAVKDGKIGGDSAAYQQKTRANIAARKRMRRRMRTVGYQISQRCRKKIEEWIGWAKTIGGLYRTRLIGQVKTGQQAHLAGAAFNLIRMRNLAAG